MQLIFQNERCELKVDGVSCLKLEAKDKSLIEFTFPDIPDAIAWHRQNLKRLLAEQKQRELRPGEKP